MCVRTYPVVCSFVRLFVCCLHQTSQCYIQTVVSVDLVVWLYCNICTFTCGTIYKIKTKKIKTRFWALTILGPSFSVRCCFILVLKVIFVFFSCRKNPRVLLSWALTNKSKNSELVLSLTRNNFVMFPKTASFHCFLTTNEP